MKQEIFMDVDLYKILLLESIDRTENFLKQQQDLLEKMESGTAQVKSKLDITNLFRNSSLQLDLDVDETLDYLYAKQLYKEPSNVTIINFYSFSNCKENYEEKYDEDYDGDGVRG